MLNYNLTLNSN